MADDRPAVGAMTVVVAARDAARGLGEQLAALRDQHDPGIPWEVVVVVDPRSCDGTEEIVREAATGSERIRLVMGDGIGGVTRARNIGVRAGTGDLVAVCDADDLVGPTWAKGFVDAAVDPRIGLWAGTTVAVPRDDGRTFGRSLASLREGLGRPMSFLPAALGANMAFRRAAWQAVGGFDESWDVVSGEEIDLSWRMQLAGYGFATAPDATITYRFRTTAQSARRQSFDYGLSAPRLYQRFRAEGARRRSTLGALRIWATLAVTVWRLAGPTDGRDRWLHLAARNAGYVVGSWRFRVYYP